MGKRVSILFIWLLALGIQVQAGSPPGFRSFLNETHRSLTGQFVVHEAPPADRYASQIIIPTNVIRLDPTLLSVSCERIKTALLKTLGERDQWKSQIIINLHHFRGADDAMEVAPELFGHEWLYRLELPDRVERSRLTSALVEVILLEMATRNSKQSIRIPDWLTQGLTREIQFSTETQLILEPPHGVENGILISHMSNSGRRIDPLTTARADLNAFAPLTLAQLSWPSAGQFQGEAGETYRSSAQFFVHELLLLPNGRVAMQNFIQSLPSHLNWQISFLQAFHNNFTNQLALEKWWALCLVQFTGRDLYQEWSNEESWRKLDEIVRPTVEVRTGPDQLPLRTQVTFQAIIRDWNRIEQMKLFQEKSQQLSLLRLRVSPEMVALVDAYRRMLDHFIKKRDSVAYIPIAKTAYSPGMDPFARDTIHDLDALDAQRQAMRPNPQLRQVPVNAISSNN